MPELSHLQLLLIMPSKRYTSELETNMDPFGQQDNDETYEEHCQ